MAFYYAENRFEVQSLAGLMVSCEQIMSDKILATALFLFLYRHHRAGRM
jgi:hypothetical protein